MEGCGSLYGRRSIIVFIIGSTGFNLKRKDPKTYCSTAIQYQLIRHYVCTVSNVLSAFKKASPRQNGMMSILRRASF